jgi:hypothetical protein
MGMATKGMHIEQSEAEAGKTQLHCVIVLYPTNDI